MMYVFDLQLFTDIENSATNTIVAGTANNDSITNTGNVSKIFGYAGNDTIISYNANSVTVNGGAGDDYIRLHDGDIAYWANNDSQNIVIDYNYGEGSDTVVGFYSDDTLRIATSKSFSTMKSGSEFYVIFDNGSITLKNLDESDIESVNIVTVKGGPHESVLPRGLSLNYSRNFMTASKRFSNKNLNLTNYSTVEIFNGEAVTHTMNITGNSLDNVIYGGSGKDVVNGGTGNDSLVGNAGNDKLIGGADEDTLDGGTGNDTLTGGNGNDVFIYNAGNDVITDYEEGDSIYIDGTSVKSWSFKGNHVVFNTGAGNLTVRNGRDKAITVTTTQVYSSSSALFAEDNFVTADNLSEITKNHLTPTSLEKISSTNFENLTQENNLITFAEK